MVRSWLIQCDQAIAANGQDITAFSNDVFDPTCGNFAYKARAHVPEVLTEESIPTLLLPPANSMWNQDVRGL